MLLSLEERMYTPEKAKDKTLPRTRQSLVCGRSPSLVSITCATRIPQTHF